MFKDCPLLALIEEKKNTYVVKRICEDRESQAAIDKTFADAAKEIKEDKTEVTVEEVIPTEGE